MVTETDILAGAGREIASRSVMAKGTRACFALAAVIAVFWIGWLAASSSVAPAPIDPLARARAFAVSQHPEAFATSDGALAYYVQEHRDVWTVEITPQGQAGGGLLLTVRRSDRRVDLVGKTQ